MYPPVDVLLSQTFHQISTVEESCATQSKLHPRKSYLCRWYIYLQDNK